MKGLLIAIVTSMILLTGSAHADSKGYCDKNPLVCERAAAWCTKHVGTSKECKQSQEIYCANHENKCKTGI